MKLLIKKEETKNYYLCDADKDFHTTDGFIKKSDLKKTGIVKTNKGKEFYVLDASFIDVYRKIKRGPQIITSKDIGLIVSETGINKNSFVVDAGTGSGALACFLANITKKVVSYETRDDFIKIAEENKKRLGLNNLIIKKGDVYKKIDEKNVDLIVLDLEEPWKAIKNAYKALKTGGFLVVYTPQITQANKVVNLILKDENFVYLKTSELIERKWRIKGEVSRPSFEGLGHTGFVSFFRRV